MDVSKLAGGRVGFDNTAHGIQFDILGEQVLHIDGCIEIG
jgi:hypothetical protein